mmetsp:Transcript_38702/g.121293  ORF Transcript_38702/g.121293 Transcript_38702/m.121293 type:complete len:819 (-) Transcript_38702:163-2619(-)
MNLSIDPKEALQLSVDAGKAGGRVARALAEAIVTMFLERLPTLEKDLYGVIDLIFTPRAILHQIVAAAVLQMGLVSWQMVYINLRRVMNHFTRNGRQISLTRRALHSSRSYEEWLGYAERLDKLEGNDAWRKSPESNIYDQRLLRRHIEELNGLMADRQVFDLMFRLRGGLARNKYGLLHEGLFNRAHTGTKCLVEEYHGTVCKALQYIAEEETEDLSIPMEAKLAFFNETRHSYGRSALMLSGGAAMGFYHVGVVKALLAQGLLPRVISGASAGSIVTAMIGVRTNEELQPLFRGERIALNFFLPHRLSPRNPRGTNGLLAGDALPGTRGSAGTGASFTLVLPPAMRWLGDMVLTLFWHNESLLKMDTEHFRSVLRANIGLYTFQEAFDRTGRIINITVSPKNRTDPPRLLNYLTAPHVLVWSAAVASSSVPGVFEASPLYVKESDGVIRPESSDGESYADGSMEADLPMAQLSELFNVNHFVVSQVNPHATLLSTLGLNQSMWQHPALHIIVGAVRFLKDQIRTWYQHVVEFLGRQTSSTQWALRQGLTQLLTQEYEGRDHDVTIWPWRGKEGLVSSFVKMLENPTMEDFLGMVTVAEANTWPSVAKVRSHNVVEQQFEMCIQVVRRRLTQERHQLASARAAAGAGESQAQLGAGLSARGRVPSFYTSPSLVKLSGLAVSDAVDLPDMRATRVGGVTLHPAGGLPPRTPSGGHLASAAAISQPSSFGSNLDVLVEAPEASPDAAAGLLIDEDSDGDDGLHVAGGVGGGTSPQSFPESGTEAPEDAPLKTSSMANFYYRRTRSADNLRSKQRSNSIF